VGSLAPQGSAGWYDHQNFNVTLPTNLAPGTYYLGGFADNNGTITETDNNWNQVQVTVTPPAQPDVRAYLNMSNLTTSAGGTINVDLWSDNFGSGSANPTVTGLYLSTDPTIDHNDILLTTRSVGSLTPQGSAGWYDHQNFNVTLPTNLAPGTYYLGGFADNNGTITETDNNWNQVQVTVTASHTVVVGSVEVSNFADASVNSMEAPAITPVAAAASLGSQLSIQENQSDLLHLALSSTPPITTVQAAAFDTNWGMAGWGAHEASAPSNPPPASQLSIQENQSDLLHLALNSIPPITTLQTATFDTNWGMAGWGAHEASTPSNPPPVSQFSIEENQSDLLHLALNSTPPITTLQAAPFDTNWGMAGWGAHEATTPSNPPQGSSTGPAFPVGGWPGSDLGLPTAPPESQLLPQHNDFHLI
jgi:hypothetical protein